MCVCVGGCYHVAGVGEDTCFMREMKFVFCVSTSTYRFVSVFCD